MPKALVLGGGETLWHDLAQVPDVAERTVIAINDSGVAYKNRIDYWVTLHPEKLPKLPTPITPPMPCKAVIPQPPCGASWPGLKPFSMRGTPCAGGSGPNGSIAIWWPKGSALTVPAASCSTLPGAKREDGCTGAGLPRGFDGRAGKTPMAKQEKIGFYDRNRAGLPTPIAIWLLGLGREAVPRLRPINRRLQRGYGPPSWPCRGPRRPGEGAGSLPPPRCRASAPPHPG